jgi:Carbohydrate binding module (family 6)/Secretion system C-terminal sorting domain/Bacterial Ig-like domain (group 2)/Domain of unknown function (DUF4832)
MSHKKGKTCKRIKNCLLIVLLAAGSFAKAQSWETLSYNANQAGLELNPLKGFATMFNPGNNFPRSIQGKLFGLDEVMSGANNFNWAVIDNFLAQQASEGRHSYIQVNIDPAFGNSDMPGYLINQVDWQYYNGSVPDSCPNWNDPDLMAAMLNFIDTFGAKYNNDSRVFLVHLGLYGMWGEWHIGDVVNIRPEFEMTEANKTLIANAYKNAFPGKYLLARYPENMPDPQLFGYSDGLFFGQSISPSNPFYFHNTLKAYNADENWKLYPVGGEIDPALQPTIFDVLPNPAGQDVFECLDSIRPTWLFCHHILTVAQPATAEWDNAIRVQKAMGYTFHIDKYRLASSNGKPAIEINLQNKGIAPMYANWDVEFGVLNAGNQFKSLGFAKWNLNLIQPGILDNYRSFVSDTVLVDGTYTFLLRVVNPLESNSAQAKPVRFANTTQDEDITGWITLGEKTLLSGNAGVMPIKVTGIAVTPSSAVMQAAQTLQLVSQVLPANATNPAITYVSDHPGTASVNANGLVTAGPAFGTVIIAAYTQDGGFKKETVITVEPNRVQIPALIEAENYIRMSGIAVENCGEGGFNLGYINNNDWMEYGVIVNSPAFFSVDFRVASPSGGGEISLINESGDTLGSIQVPVTGGWQTYTRITLNSVSLPAGAYTLKLLARKGGFNLNWIEFKYPAVLPVTLLDIRAIPKKEHIVVEWTTSFEDNNEGFYVERSTNANDFNKISWVGSKGSSNGLNQYSFTDSGVEKNINYYYRLVQQDKDKKLSYSKIVSAKLSKAGIDLSKLISLYPNPAANSIKINWDNTALNIRLSDITIFNAAGVNVTPVISNDRIIDLSHLPEGVYFLRVEIEGEKVTKKITKIKN